MNVFIARQTIESNLRIAKHGFYWLCMASALSAPAFSQEYAVGQNGGQNVGQKSSTGQAFPVAQVSQVGFESPERSMIDGGILLADRLVVKKSERRLYLMRHGQVLKSFRVALGLNPQGHKEREGDFKTPEGTYRLVRRNPRSDFFLSMQVSYPNERDATRAQRLGVKPGGAIMLHGWPNVPRKNTEYYASADWTDGCIAVSNSDMVEVWLRTPIDTPIDIYP
jgi:murein L,D-transpeptidase YafK